MSQHSYEEIDRTLLDTTNHWRPREGRDLFVTRPENPDERSQGQRELAKVSKGVLLERGKKKSDALLYSQHPEISLSPAGPDLPGDKKNPSHSPGLRWVTQAIRNYPAEENNGQV